MEYAWTIVEYRGVSWNTPVPWNSVEYNGISWNTNLSGGVGKLLTRDASRDHFQAPGITQWPKGITQV